MAQLKVTHRDLDSVLLARTNPKRHALETVAASIRRFGFLDPVIVDGRTGRVVGGHGRIEALNAMRTGGEPRPSGIGGRGDTWLVPTVDGWQSANDGEADAALVALNLTSEQGGWDLTELAALLDQLPGLDGVGYDDAVEACLLYTSPSPRD